jgi:hypothetical protein
MNSRASWVWDKLMKERFPEKNDGTKRIPKVLVAVSRSAKRRKIIDDHRFPDDESVHVVMG